MDGHSVIIPQGCTHVHHSILGLPMWYPAKDILTTNAASLQSSVDLGQVDGMRSPAYEGSEKGIDVKLS